MRNGPRRGRFYGLTREAGNLSAGSIVRSVENLRDFRRIFLETRKELIDHLQKHAFRTDGPFTLRSGEISPWYLDARQTTLDGVGATLVGRAILGVLDDRVTAVGGLTMGADPMAVATAVVATGAGIPLRAFSVRKEAKNHGIGGRLVGPLRPGDRIAVLEDTTTTGGALLEAITVIDAAGYDITQAIALADRSGGVVSDKLNDLGIAFTVLVTPEELER